MGSGKTTLVKELLGEVQAQPSKCSDVIDCYVSTDSEGNVARIFDIIGFNDPEIEDDEIIRSIVEQTERKVDLLFLCINMRGRIGRADVDIMKMLTEAFYTPEETHEDKDSCGLGTVSSRALSSATSKINYSIWKHTVIVLTFANEVDAPFEDILERFRVDLHRHLRKIEVPDSIVEKVEVLPAGYGIPPDGSRLEHWARDLIIHSANSISNDSARKAYLKLLVKQLTAKTGPEKRGLFHNYLLIAHLKRLLHTLQELMKPNV